MRTIDELFNEQNWMLNEYNRVRNIGICPDCHASRFDRAKGSTLNIVWCVNCRKYIRIESLNFIQYEGELEEGMILYEND